LTSIPLAPTSASVPVSPMTGSAPFAIGQIRSRIRNATVETQQRTFASPVA
jgi:hypothetical protein